MINNLMLKIKKTFQSEIKRFVYQLTYQFKDLKPAEEFFQFCFSPYQQIPNSCLQG